MSPCRAFLPCRKGVMANGHNTYTHDNATAPGIALAHTIHGEAVNASVRPESAAPGTTRAVGSVFSPYKPPARRAHDKGKTLCSEEGCKSYPIKDKSYCAGHARQHGELPVCAKRDCNAPPKKGQSYCHWHGPKVTDESD